MLPRVSYLEAREMLVKQKEAILARIRQVSRSHIVHRGRDVFADDSVTQADPNTVPGLSRVAHMMACGAHVVGQRTSAGIQHWTSYHGNRKEDLNS